MPQPKMPLSPLIRPIGLQDVDRKPTGGPFSAPSTTAEGLRASAEKGLRQAHHPVARATSSLEKLLGTPS